MACGHNRVARLMRQAGLVGCHRRRPAHVRTTRRDPAASPAPDLVQRSFAASDPDQLWVADITYLPTEQEGFLYLAVILDVWSRRVVGWSMQKHLHTELILAALEMAVWNRRPAAGSFTIRIMAANTRRSSLVSGVRWRGSVPRWGRLGIVTTMRWPNVASPPWSANSWPSTASGPTKRRGQRSLSGWKSFTIASDGIRHWGMSRQQCMNKWPLR
jgi:hypothetical protein